MILSEESHEPCGEEDLAWGCLGDILASESLESIAEHPILLQSELGDVLVNPSLRLSVFVLNAAVRVQLHLTSAAGAIAYRLAAC